MSTKVLVLTATGTTGSHVVSALVAEGATVRAATRNPAAARLPAGVDVVAFSYDDRATWPAAFAGVDAVYLAQPAFRADEVELGKALIDTAKAAGVQRVVKLSAIGVENNPESGHRQVELYLEGSGLKWAHVRPNFFHENFVEFYGSTVKGDGAIYLPAGKGQTSFVAAADIGRVAARALLGQADGQALVLTGSEALDHDAVAAALSAALSRPVRFVDITPEAHVEGMKAWGMDPIAVGTMSALYGFVREGWVSGLSPDVQRITGREPQRFADWARENVAAWQ
jgi:uncharacterized protein YbjT (DUF2867 family)